MGQSQREKLMKCLHFGQKIHVLKFKEKQCMISTDIEATESSCMLWASVVGKAA